jgi:hypothetical protein
MNDSNIDRLQMDLKGLVQWAVEYAMEINPGSRKAISFTRALLKDLLIYFFWGGGGGGTKQFRKRADANI